MHLMKDILRPFNRSRNKLGVKHYVQAVNTEVSFCLLITSVHFDGIAHGLKCMEGKPNRQQNAQIWDWIAFAKVFHQKCNVFINEIEVLEDG